MRLNNVEVSGITRVCFVSTGDTWSRQCRDGVLSWQRESLCDNYQNEVSQETMVRWIKRACTPGGRRRVWIHGETANIVDRIDGSTAISEGDALRSALVALVDADIGRVVATISRLDTGLGTLRDLRRRTRGANIVKP